MQRFKSPQQTQTFLSIFGIIYDYFHPKKHQLSADIYREQLANRFGTLGISDIDPQMSAKRSVSQVRPTALHD